MIHLCSLFLLFILFSSSLVLSSCSTLTSSSKASMHQLELSVHKVRTDVEELKHDLNTYEIEHHVLEGKLSDQAEVIATLKNQISQFKQGKLQSFVDQLQEFEKNLQEVQATQTQIAADLRKLSSHANGTTTALSQYKSKISELEKTLHSHQKELLEVLSLKERIFDLLASPLQTYTVKPGDSLGKIGRKFNLSVEEIKECNHLSSDHIVPGQKIKLPAKEKS